MLLMWHPIEAQGGQGAASIATLAFLLRLVASVRQACAGQDSSTAAAAAPNLAALAFRDGSLDTAAAHVEAVLAAAHVPPEAFVTAAAVALQGGDAAAARRHCQAALRMQPDCMDAHYNLG